MRDGFIDRAARKDEKEALKQQCPPGQSWQKVCKESDEDELECKWGCL